MAEIKVCGLTKTDEARVLAECGVEYAGMVMFYPNSKRNITEKKAAEILKVIHKENISKAVAVVVSPTLQQLNTVTELGFDYIQIHGDLTREVYEADTLPVIRALNIKNQNMLQLRQDINALHSKEKITAVLCDAGTPGSGKTFDWSSIRQLDKNDKLFILAGGLNTANINTAITEVRPDVVDVSSGVEYDLTEGEVFRGKDIEKIRTFVQKVRKMEEN